MTGEADEAPRRARWLVLAVALIAALNFAPILTVVAMFRFGGGAETVTRRKVARVVSPDGGFVAATDDVLVELYLFEITSLTTDLRLHRVGRAGKGVEIVGLDTGGAPALRPQARWVAVDRLCVVTPHVDSMQVHAGVIDGVTVDVHVLPWNQKWPPPKIDLDATCR